MMDKNLFLYYWLIFQTLYSLRRTKKKGSLFIFVLVLSNIPINEEFANQGFKYRSKGLYRKFAGMARHSARRAVPCHAEPTCVGHQNTRVPTHYAMKYLFFGTSIFLFLIIFFIKFMALH